jgi:hypothetical protein
MPINFFSRKVGRFKAILLNLLPFILSGAIFLSIKLAVRRPEFVEHYYSKGIYPFIARFFSFLSSFIPFSLWDVFWILFLLLIISGLILVLFRRINAGWFILRTLQTIALLYSLFYLVWGYNYFRPAISIRIGWESPKADEMNFRSVLDSIIIETNHNYFPDASSDYAKIDTLVEESYRNNSRVLGISYPNGSRRPKTMLFSTLFAKVGVNGYFGPYFNEIHMNYFLLPVDYPFSLAHEKAHQFGFASEAEANLAAFVVCVTSSDQSLRYSGYQTLLLYFLSDATRLDDYKKYLDKIDKNVLKDLQYRQKYYLSLQNKKLSEMQSKVNNAYLKVNRIEKGVKNYNQVVSLVISWYYNANLIKEKTQ